MVRRRFHKYGGAAPGHSPHPRNRLHPGHRHRLWSGAGPRHAGRGRPGPCLCSGGDPDRHRPRWWSWPARPYAPFRLALPKRPDTRATGGASCSKNHHAAAPCSNWLWAPRWPRPAPMGKPRARTPRRTISPGCRKNYPTGTAGASTIKWARST